MRVLSNIVCAGIIAASSFCPRAGAADTIDGNRLLELCAAQDPVCTGYAMGVADARNNDPHGIAFCVPEGVSQAQLHEVVVKFLRKTADRRFPAALLVSGAFAEAFRCPR